MSKRRQTVSDAVRRAIEKSGVSRYRICREAGIDKASISRFMAGKTGLTLASLDALAEVLGLDLVARGPVRVSPLAKPGRKPKKGR
jgi:transcriptional regulator with XRE-family HTH domain